ncbi:MAG: YggT family protein [Chloroflexota bacterium]|nr:YggT family protein [Chloroflexota bacterium]
MRDVLLYIINLLFSLYSLVIVARVLMEMFVDPLHPAVRVLRQFTEPVLAPVRRVIPPIRMVDVSPAAALLLLYILRVVLVSFIASVLR